MYNDELTERTICTRHIYLDPNNPRFWQQNSRRQVPDTRIAEDSVQSKTEQMILRYGIEELHNSILRNGFLPLDRIVVRPLHDRENGYVVVEGNRRLAAIKLLRERIRDGLIIEENISEEYLSNLLAQTEELSVLVYSGSHSSDISWIFQGIRHIGGVRQWEPAQRAKLIADQYETGSYSFTETGQKFGLSARSVGRLYRSYKALEQMRSDDEYGSQARNDYFSLFEEAYRNSNVRKWLDWSETEFCFQNKDNLHRFYSWISPDEEDSEARRRIHNPKHVKCLAALISDDNRSLIEKVERHELSIETAEVQAHELNPGVPWKEKLRASLNNIKQLPAQVIRENPSEYKQLIEEMVVELQGYCRLADSIVDPRDDT